MFRRNTRNRPATFSNWSMSQTRSDDCVTVRAVEGGSAMEKPVAPMICPRRFKTLDDFISALAVVGDLHGAHGQKCHIARRVALRMQGPPYEKAEPLRSNMAS